MKTQSELGSNTIGTGLSPAQGPRAYGVQGTKQLLRGLALAAVLMVPCLTLAAGPASVDLGTAGHFTILSGAAITTTGGGVITGDVGASPIAGSAIGIPPPQVNGIIYAVDSTGTAGPNVIVDPGLLTTAKGDLTTAYNSAAGRTPVPTGTFLNPNGGNLGGQVLVPGLYKITGTTLISGANLTLVGGPNDVWIFQCAQDLQVGVGMQVILTGGALAVNVFWQVGTSAVLGTSSVMKGTIMADQSITMNTSSTLEGRALARIAGVTFNGTSGSLPLAVLTVVASPTNGGSVTGSGSFLVGSTNPISATASNLWEFVAWNDGNTNNARNIVLLSNTTYTAFFVNTNLPLVPLLVLANPTNGGAVTGSGSYLVGTPVQITATASNGWRFTQWDDAVTNNPRTVVVPVGGATNTADFVTSVPRAYFQDSSGQLASWVLNSTGGIASASLLGNPSGWVLAAAGDINGDGTSDLIFETGAGDVAILFMNADGSVLSGRQILSFNIDPMWQIAAAGDWAGTGNAQIFFQMATGQTAYWVLTTNGDLINSVYMGNMGAWKLRGVGYLFINGDPKAELLWQDPAGHFAVWFHQPDNSVASMLLPYSVGGWVLHGVVDIDGGGVSDLLWQDSSGNVANWFMNTNGVLQSAGFMGNTGGWKLKAAGR